EDSKTFHFRFSVSYQNNYLTANDVIYDATCSFGTSKRYRVDYSTEDNPSQEPGRPRKRSGEDCYDESGEKTDCPSDSSLDGLTYKKLYEISENIDSLQLKVFDESKKSYSNKIEVGNEIRLVILKENNSGTVVDIQTECTMYSSKQKDLESEYPLTSETGCSSLINNLFVGQMSVIPDSLKEGLTEGNETMYGIITPIFKAPYYTKTGELYFECIAKFCNETDTDCNQLVDCNNSTERRYKVRFYAKI
ncbi:MAG: hypothetical protein MHPSP_001211, partial [Paramarteilia canceri]